MNVEHIDREVIKKYEIVRKIGKGAYGVVWKAIDKKKRTFVALKKIFDAFQNATDAQRTYREVYLLRTLKHKNVVKLYDIMKAENNLDLYLVFEFVDSDLTHVLAANLLQPIHKQYILYQLLKVVQYLHSVDVIHRDIKPSNILINSNCQLKICDFGLARSVSTETPILTTYVATRWYRAPEILLGSRRYLKSVDVWSIGCIFAELLTGKPAFQGIKRDEEQRIILIHGVLYAGNSTINQLQQILEVTTQPTRQDVEEIHATAAMALVQRAKPTRFSLIPDATPEALDLLAKLLEFNPKKRITIVEALEHPFLEQFNKKSENQAPQEQPVSIPVDDDVRLGIDEYRGLLYSYASNGINRVAIKRTPQSTSLGYSTQQGNVRSSYYGNAARNKLYSSYNHRH